MNALTQRLVTLVVLALLPAAGHAEWVDYAQAETTSSATTFVLVRAVGATDGATPAALVSTTYARWKTGEAASIGYVWRRVLASQDQRWLVGAGLGANTFHSRATGDEQHDSAVSARLQSEWFGPVAGGSYYALAQASSFRGSWLATAQYSPSSLPVSAEWTRYHERNYQATSLGVRVATGVPRWFVRGGVTRAQGESRPYIGIAYNGF